MRAKKALFLLPTLTAPSGAAKGHSVWGGGGGGSRAGCYSQEGSLEERSLEVGFD